MASKRPTTIAEYIRAAPREGQPQREIPDLLCSDHLCDALRYAVMHLRDHDYSEPETVEYGYKPGSYGHLLDHASVWERDEGARMEDVYRMEQAAEHARKCDWRRGHKGIYLPPRRPW